ncbi:hypothetical protein EDD22DRAFT_1009458 [Suillus occidentalis]|nr:hypothetical protein EDD22DRAFT_1009458 [Suillus occidentalis]
MILLLCVVLCFVPFVCTSLPSLNDTYILTLDARDSPSCGNTRTLLDILSSCGLTLFACTWTAIHLDIPDVGEGIVAITFRHLLLMVVAFLASEFVVAWAAWQLLCARQVKIDFNIHIDGSVTDEIPNSNRSSSASQSHSESLFRKKLTNGHWTHGFFAWMGGFVLYVGDERWATLTPEELLQFVREGSVEMPAITEADIKNRSAEGNILSKCVAILQLLWFIVQLIARYAKNLPVTLLEIDTLGVAILTCIAYGLWLKKPKNARFPHIVHWNKSATPPQARQLSQPSFGPPLFNNTGRTSESAPSDLRLSRRKQITSIIGCTSGMAFGMIHCLGWNFSFPKYTEQILWRVASIGIPYTLFIGILAFFQTRLFRLLGVLIPELESIVTFGNAFTVMILLLTGGLIDYLLARVIIIVLMMMSFRSLPPGTYDTVAWSEYILHLDL